MIGFEYGGQVNYITKMEDFRDYMEPSVYEALVRALSGGLWGEDYRQKYEELKEEYDALESDYDELDDVNDELLECQKDLDGMVEKFEALQKCIGVIINQSYLGYIKQEDIIPQLEKLI